MRLILHSIMITILLVLMSCSKDVIIEEAGFEKSFSIAKKKYNNNNFREAIDDLNVIMLNYGGVAGIDSVQYMIGESHYRLSEFYSASYEFVRLTEMYPESYLVEDAYFMDAESYYNLSPRYALDQTDTHKAISKYQLYLDLFPKGKKVKLAEQRISELREKLARKEYEAAMLYLNLRQPRAAKIYFSEVINNFYDTSYYVNSLKGIAQAFLDMDNVEEYEKFMSRYSNVNKRDE
ncbi:MAG: outer membrane protein assembly factor BamD [Candidatus Delongbacteria bacterium]